jgi:hypothetical protein
MARVIYGPGNPPTPDDAPAAVYFGAWYRLANISYTLAAADGARRMVLIDWDPKGRKRWIAFGGEKSTCHSNEHKAMDSVDGSRIEAWTRRLGELAPAMMRECVAISQCPDQDAFRDTVDKPESAIGAWPGACSQLYAAVLGSSRDDAAGFARKHLITQYSKNVGPERCDHLADATMYVLAYIERSERRLAARRADKGETLGRPAAEAMRGVFSDPTLDDMHAGLDALLWAWRRVGGDIGAPAVQAALRRVEAAGSAIATVPGCAYDAKHLGREINKWADVVGLPPFTVTFVKAPAAALAT